MTINNWLGQSQKLLKVAGISTARLDCLVLLGDKLEKDKAWLLSHPEYNLQGSEIELLNTNIAQRARHVPLAYIRGKAEFYGRDFAVNEHTLVPRPETETMIDMLKLVRNLEADVAAWQVERRGRKLMKKKYAFEKNEPDSSLMKTDKGYEVVWEKPLRRQLTQKPAPIHGQSLRYHDEQFHLVDVGTGSGALAITAKLEMPDASVTAIDIDKKCLETAQTNAQNLDADITFLHGNLLQPIYNLEPGTSNLVLLCNLPYVPDDFHINTAATHEPKHAIFGGKDGLDLYRELFEQIQSNNWRPAYVLTESLPPQHETMVSIAKSIGYKLHRTDDFIQLFSL